jgi:hypothetical protein
MNETLLMVMHEWEAVLLSNRTRFCANKRFWIKQELAYQLGGYGNEPRYNVHSFVKSILMI